MSTAQNLFPSLGHLKGTIEPALHLTQIFALIVAGVWTYYHFVKGRTFHSRINLDLKISPLFDGEKRFIRMAICARNVGPSKVVFHGDESVLYLVPGKSIREHSTETCWQTKDQIALPLFTEHSFIESGEEIYEERLISIRGKQKSFKAIARLRSADQKRTTTSVTRFTTENGQEPKRT